LSSKPRKRIKGYFYPVQDELMKSKLAEYIGPTGLQVIALIGIKHNKLGEAERNNLSLTYKEAGRFMSSHKFARAIFRLWAYRMIKVVNWGRRGREPSRYAMFNKWIALIRMPGKLKKLHDLVCEYEEIQKQYYTSESGNPGNKNQFTMNKRSRLLEIKRKIINVKL